MQNTEELNEIFAFVGDLVDAVLKASGEENPDEIADVFKGALRSAQGMAIENEGGDEPA